jgi:pimeloyl-ACP methyl ester carboxylesterase
MTQNMIKYLEQIYSENGGQPIVIIAHSMGGLISLSAAQKRPELVRGVVFCGTPFGLGGVPLVLWGIQRGMK